MNPRANRLVARLLVIQVLVQLVTFALIALFAPRVLLLEPAATSAAVTLAIGVGGACVIFSTFTTLFMSRPLRPALRILALGGVDVKRTDILGLYGMPWRLALLTALFGVALAFATLALPLRPQGLDAYTGLALVLLFVTLASVAALPAYVMMRASVARALELVSPEVSEEALRHLGRSAVGRVRKRFVAAVVAPVAFVALGSSLLVDAHVRAYDRGARATDAIDAVRAVFDPVAGETRGIPKAIEAAEKLGYHITLDNASPGEVIVRHDENGDTRVIVPLASGAAAVRFGAARFSSVTAIYVLLAAIAIALSVILGSRIGTVFESDVALATREVRRAGVAEVMRGTIILHEARFAIMHDLLSAIDGLGGIFREFASAQQRAIEARGATERMRGLLLASMSHDLKAPLNAVLGFAELVGRNELTEGQRENLAIIEQRGRELLMLIDTILDSARVEAGELAVSPEQTHVGDVVMSSVLEARDLAVGTDVQIMGEVQPGMPTLLVDGSRIVQALTAVVMTAVRFSHKGIVPVRATLPDLADRLRVEVETSGEGLPMTEREKIFDAFKSAESARRHGALGLGLQLARSIVEIHSGTIEVDSTAGGGMVFRVWLPVMQDRRSIRERASRPALPEG